MNRVINAEIATHIFSIEEKANRKLQSYFKEIKKQLAHTDSAIEVYRDIEHRVAELLFEINNNKHDAININHIKNIIEQVGYFENEEVIIEHISPNAASTPTLMKNTFLILFAIITISTGLLLIEISESSAHLKIGFWLLVMATLFLITIGWISFIKNYYLNYPKSKPEKIYKVGIIIACIIIFVTMTFL